MLYKDRKFIFVSLERACVSCVSLHVSVLLFLEPLGAMHIYLKALR